MNKLTIYENIYDPSEVTTYKVDGDIRPILKQHFGEWPTTGHIFHNHVAESCDVTPFDEAGVERLGTLCGEFFIVIYPEGLEVIFIIIAIVVAAVAIGLALLFRPSANVKQNQQASPNNQLSDRQNRDRTNQRIEDIYGEVRSVPSLISVPYRVFEASKEVEYSYMCIGRGSYTIGDIKDDVTPIADIDGASAAVYAPNTSPNSGDDPQTAVGPVISELIKTIKINTAVNGQTLTAPNANNVDKTGATAIGFQYPDLIFNDGSIDFTDFFSPGPIDGTPHHLTVTSSSAVDPSGAHGPVGLNGTYQIAAVAPDSITLVTPSTVNGNWATLALYDGGAGDSLLGGAKLSASDGKILGPFVCPVGDMTEIWCNFVAQNGSYKVLADGTNVEVDTQIAAIITPIDSLRNQIGPSLTYNCTLLGSANLKNTRGVTLKIILPAAGFYMIEAYRVTATDLTAGVQVSDIVQWRDLYMVSPMTLTDFGDVTTVQTRTFPTQDALAVKARKLNMLVTRNLPVYTPGGGGTAGTFAGSAPTKNTFDIICAMALDPYIGGRDVSELDLVGMYNLLKAGGTIETYFGSNTDTPASLVTEFCYTFDDSKVSFEESLGDIAQVIFCDAYRRGKVISLSFEKETANSVLLFNHRNKIPKSETRTVTFGSLDQYDGIELDYIDPNAPNYPDIDTTVTLYFPTDKSAKNPRKITSIGIRNNVQATLLGWRLFNKLRYQNTTTEFEATQEAALLVRSDRILVADNTRSDTQDGQVTDVSGLTLTLSQPVKFQGGLTYTIFLQHDDATVEALGITAGVLPNQVVLAGAPSRPLVTDPTNYAQTIYMIVSSAPTRSNAFLLAEKKPKNNYVYTLSAVNYDDRYYAHDGDIQSGALHYNQLDGGSGGGGGGGTSGTQYNPSVYDDKGGTTSYPTAAYDNNGTTAASCCGRCVRTIAPDSPIGSPAYEYNEQDGDIVYSGFRYLTLTAGGTLHVKAAVNLASVSHAVTLVVKIAGVTTVLINTTAVVAFADYTVAVPNGTNMRDITIEATALGGMVGSGYGKVFSNISIYDIYIIAT